MVFFKRVITVAMFLAPTVGFCAGTPSYDVKADTNTQQLIKLQQEQLKELQAIRVQLEENNARIFLLHQQIEKVKSIVFVVGSVKEKTNE